MLAVSLMLGMLLALTRRRPDLERLKKPRLIATLDSFGAASETQK
jgi:cell division protein FtsW